MSSFAARLAAVSTRRRVAIALVAAAVVAAAVTVVARSERAHWIDSQIRGIEHVRALVGPLDQPRLYGYRVLPQFDCLVYRRGGNPYALELCIDGAGRVVEAIDRRAPARRYYSLRAEPDASTVTVDTVAVRRLLRRMGAIGG